VTRAVLSLGSNLGDRAAQLTAAVRGLSGWLIAVSGVYQTPPWGDPDQPDYLNAVALVQDDAAGPRDWLLRARALEGAAGRVRDPARRFGPRTLDVDVIAVWTADGEPIIATDPELTLPHPRAHLRAFVLRPWLEIAPYASLPGHGWVNDLMRTPAITADLPDLRPRPDIELEPTTAAESGPPDAAAATGPVHNETDTEPVKSATETGPVNSAAETGPVNSVTEAGPAGNADQREAVPTPDQTEAP
jgi:2-amino-4-hydroxy-6-hydroxymethyldihydropteridine diphosphokinase